VVFKTGVDVSVWVDSSEVGAGCEDSIGVDE
jgi:hypothetical protein